MGRENESKSGASRMKTWRERSQKIGNFFKSESSQASNQHAINQPNVQQASKRDDNQGMTEGIERVNAQIRSQDDCHDSGQIPSQIDGQDDGDASSDNVVVALRLPEDSNNVEAEVAIRPVAASSETVDIQPNGAAQTQKQPIGALDAAEDTPVSKSQELWNDAFNALETDDETKELVEGYTKILNVNLGSDAASDTDPRSNSAAVRQKQMARLVASGQEKIKRSSKITKNVGSVVETILLAKPVGDFLIASIPHAAPAAIPWAAVCGALQILCNPAKSDKINREGLTHVVSQMEWYCALTDCIFGDENLKNRQGDTLEILKGLKVTIVGLHKELLGFLVRSICSYYEHQGLAFFKKAILPEEWSGALQKIKKAENEVDSKLDQCVTQEKAATLHGILNEAKKTTEQLDNIHKTIKDFVAEQIARRTTEADDRLLDELRVVDPQDDMDTIEKKKDTLFEGSFTWILDDPMFTNFTSDTYIDDHNNDSGGISTPVSPTKPHKPLLSIRGDAGTGKTMLQIGIIRHLSTLPVAYSPSIAYFFFQHADEKVNSCLAALRSLIYMLLLQQPHLMHHMRGKYKTMTPPYVDPKTENDKDRALTSLESVFEKMLQDAELRPVIFIVDALDECDQKQFAFIKIIANSTACSDKVRWLVSSRPNSQLSARFPNCELVLNVDKLKAPVEAYIRHQVSILEDENGYSKAATEEISSVMISNSENTYLWVWLAFQQLKPDEDGSLLDESDALTAIKTFPYKLSDVYSRIMTKISLRRGGTSKYCKAALEAVHLAYRPLSIAELATFIPFQRDSGLTIDPVKQTVRIIGECGSFLNVVDNVVNLIHKSANDYLKNEYQSVFGSTSAANGHARLSEDCIRAMGGLRRNIYDLPDIGPYDQDSPTPFPDPLASMRYACVHWVDHLRDTIDKLSTHEGCLPDTLLVLSFLQKHLLLHWLEALSLLRRLSDAIAAVRTLQILILEFEDTSELSGFVNDTLRFALAFRFCIEEAPLQAYVSALLFSPANSKVRKCFKNEEPTWVKKKPTVDAEWSPLLQTLEGHKNDVTSVAFSPDGKQLSSGSEDKTIKIWDVASGECIQTLEGHTDWVDSVIFFPLDRQQIASASRDMTIKFWNVGSGACTRTLEGHSHWVMSVAFSPDGKQLASASFDMAIKIWDVVSGECTKTITGHTGPANYVVFLPPDGRRLASGASDRTVRIWDAASGTCILRLNTRSPTVHLLTCSPDGKYLTSFYAFEEVETWNLLSGESTGNLEAHKLLPSSVDFKSSGRVQLTAYWDQETIKVFDTMVGDVTPFVKNIRYQYSTVCLFVVFSADGKQLASTWKDGTAKIWNVESRECTHIIRSRIANSAIFSLDGTRLVLGCDSADITDIEIWDIASEVCTKRLNCQMGRKSGGENVPSFGLSPDGSLLASVSRDTWDHCNIVRVWDMLSGQCTHAFQDRGSTEASIRFARDGKHLLYRSAILARVWSLISGECVARFPYGVIRHNPFAGQFPEEKAARDEGLEWKGRWIKRGGKPLLWVPGEYRVGAYAIFGQYIAFGSPGQNVMILEL